MPKATFRHGDVDAAMIVCSCNILSDGQVRACLGPGPDCPRTAAQVYQCLGCSPKCGRCARTIRQIVADALDATAPSLGCAATCAALCPMSHADGAHEHAHHPAEPPLFATA